MAEPDGWNGELQELGRFGFALALQLLHHREDAADALQDSLYAALKNRHRFDARRGDLRAWFLKIVRNRCRDVLRRRSRKRQETVDLSELESHRTPRPDVSAEHRELVAEVRTQLARLPTEQREIILLRDFHSLSYAQIAQVLSIPAGTVMSRLHRARAELGRRLRTDK